MDGEWQVDLKEQLGFIFGRGIMQHYQEKSRGKETTARPAMLSPRQCVQPAQRTGREGWVWNQGENLVQTLQLITSVTLGRLRSLDPCFLT